MVWKRERMPDLTSHNELVVNGVQWGASLWAGGTVNINTLGFMLPFNDERIAKVVTGDVQI